MQTVEVVQRLLTLSYFKMAERIDVIPDKAFMPDNGDKRSYVSLATYCWPSNPHDLKNPKGPWECKDGLPFPGVRPHPPPPLYAYIPPPRGECAVRPWAMFTPVGVVLSRVMHALVMECPATEWL